MAFEWNKSNAKACTLMAEEVFKKYGLIESDIMTSFDNV